MSSIKQRIDAKKKKEAIGMLKELIKKIEREKFVVTSNGYWQGTPGTWIFRVDVKDADFSDNSG